MNFSILFTVSAARDLVLFSLGHIPVTAISIFGYVDNKKSVPSKIVFAMAMQLLYPFRILFEPVDKITFFGLSGNPPFIILQFTCWALSPAMPRFRQPGSFDLERGRRERRNKRSICEAPARQFTGFGFSPRQQWPSYFPPQVLFGSLLLTWENERGEGHKLLLSRGGILIETVV